MFEEILKEQREIARKFGAEWFQTEIQSMVGINKEIGKNTYPIHGLRHSPEGNGTGWFIWAGTNEIPQNDDNFFSPTHAEHIYKDNPLIAKYLGLPPGWRFVIDDKGYEDVWFDEKIIKP